MTMEFPYATPGLRHQHGGNIEMIKRIEHETAKPIDGQSQDVWWFRGVVQWDDGSSSEDAMIYPWALRTGDDSAAKAHADAILRVLNDYLDANGEWRISAPSGWYAHQRPDEHVLKGRRTRRNQSTERRT
jgi:hypothetical protein